MYVDDMAFEADCDDLAYELYMNSETILKEGGFNLRKFLTNSTDLQRKIEDDEKLLHTNMKPDSEGDNSCVQHTWINSAFKSSGDPGARCEMGTSSRLNSCLTSRT